MRGRFNYMRFPCSIFAFMPKQVDATGSVRARFHLIHGRIFAVHSALLSGGGWRAGAAGRRSIAIHRTSRRNAQPFLSRSCGVALDRGWRGGRAASAWAISADPRVLTCSSTVATRNGSPTRSTSVPAPICSGRSFRRHSGQRSPAAQQVRPKGARFIEIADALVQPHECIHWPLQQVVHRG